MFTSRVPAHATRHNPFTTPQARALLTGVAAHAVGKLPSVASTVVALLLAHNAHGGTVHTGHHVRDLAELGERPARPAGRRPQGGPCPRRATAARPLPAGLRSLPVRPGAAKADFLVSGAIPWGDPLVGRTGTVHLGGTRADIIRRETATAAGERVPDPLTLVVDPAVADPSLASARQTARVGLRPCAQR
uniref:Phytoene dehydrogenase n=1 Tax=Streptomyces antibioticus TaxID=1890 RepID=A0A1S5RMQ8_STRAT|nr:phytoene dehydrogenase [Streptomyces antibioticus]